MSNIPNRTLGDSELTTSRLGLGLAALGRPGYITLDHAADLDDDHDPQAMARHAHTVLDAAWDAGIRYFDTARSYGKGETFVAQWLQARGHAPADQIVGSKWGYTYTADWQTDAPVHEVKEHTPENFDRQWAESQAELGEFLRLYQIHSATFDSGGLQDPQVLGRMYMLREQGITIGLTLSGDEQAEAVIHTVQLAANGTRLFDTIQATWNLLEPSVGNALSLAHQMGMGIIVKEVLANGRLTARNQEPDFAPKRVVLEEIAADVGATIDAVAIAAALYQPWADVILSGAATPEQVQSNARAFEIELHPEHWAKLAQLPEYPPDYWEKRSQLAWN
ncbi:MAG: aldo/keto reductase [Litorilinea sp.]